MVWTGERFVLKPEWDAADASELTDGEVTIPRVTAAALAACLLALSAMARATAGSMRSRFPSSMKVRAER